MSSLAYTLCPVDPSGHLFEVTLRVPATDSQTCCLRLPNWIPGSYMIREFARNIVEIEARDARGDVRLQKIDKCRWQAADLDGEFEVRALVYAWDLSVRAAHLDATHGYFNGTSVFLVPEGMESVPCSVRIEPPRGQVEGEWAVATSLTATDTDGQGFGDYRADDYADLIDHPVEMGAFERYTFEACGIPHELVLSGRFSTDAQVITDDLVRICEHHIRFFGEPAPFDRYVFLVMVVGDGYGGLEHRFSTSLVASRKSLPIPGSRDRHDDYVDFLGLCSHEYFHAWNVKRLRPAALATSTLDREAHTELLWAFEGITSYYDDLALVRAGLISHERYLALLGKTLTRVRQTPGRLRQSVGESSFDAWTRFYKQDENAPNAIISYYAKGMLVALALDLELRRLTNGQRTLDDLMRLMWARRDEANGLDEDGIEQLATEVAGADLSAFFDQAVRGTRDLELEAALVSVGIDLIWEADPALARSPAPVASTAWLDQGLRIDFSAPLARVTHVLNGTPAHAAGLSAGDLLVALDGLRASEANLVDRIRRVQPGESLRLDFFRRDELRHTDLVPTSANATHARLGLRDGGREQRSVWLGDA